MTQDNTPKNTGTLSNTADVTSTTSSSEPSRCNTLERIMDMTDEMAHLNELVLLHLKKEGGFTTPERYLDIVQPVLDLLEVEISVRYHPGMTTKEMKLVVQDWIDCEIAQLRKDS
ncbi:MAG: hypothetical protein Q8R70_05925 [Methanoregula sp.]|nr:hypothetical protein [Methanoregula sp.]